MKCVCNVTAIGYAKCILGTLTDRKYPENSQGNRFPSIEVIKRLDDRISRRAFITRIEMHSKLE